jgi:hypothetical protein
MKHSKDTQSATFPKRLSPELAEVLHMLKSLEARPVPMPAAVAAST